MSRFTRQIEDCRKRWNRRTLRFVVQVARIVEKAKKAAGQRRRWALWIKDELRMDTSTITRYRRVEAFTRRNNDLNHLFRCLTISKLYALSRLPDHRARKLLHSKSIALMTDLSFLKLSRRLVHRRPYRSNVENLSRQLDAAVHRMETTVQKWKHSRFQVPPALSARLRRQIQGLTELLDGMKIQTKAV